MTDPRKGRPRLRPYEALYRYFLRMAERVNHTVELSYEEFLGFVSIDECHYCGSLISWVKSTQSRESLSYNLDRKDNSHGYSVSNCVVCCTRCNLSKGNRFTYDEWKKIGAFIKSMPP